MYMNVAPLGGQEMAQFMDENDEAESEDDLGDGPDAFQAELVPDEADGGADGAQRALAAELPDDGAPAATMVLDTERLHAVRGHRHDDSTSPRAPPCARAVIGTGCGGRSTRTRDRRRS